MKLKSFSIYPLLLSRDYLAKKDVFREVEDIEYASSLKKLTSDTEQELGRRPETLEPIARNNVKINHVE